MGLDKRGWGIVSELVAILVAVILLVYVVYGLNRLGLLRNSDNSLPSFRPDLVINGKTTTYENLETYLIDASKKYIEQRYDNNFVGDKIVIRVSHLIKNGYMSTIRDTKNKECSGYVMVVRAQSSVNYNPYLKCSKYTTDGYESEYDW